MVDPESEEDLVDVGRKASQREVVAERLDCFSKSRDGEEEGVLHGVVCLSGCGCVGLDSKWKCLERY